MAFKGALSEQSPAHREAAAASAARYRWAEAAETFERVVLKLPPLGFRECAGHRLHKMAKILLYRFRSAPSYK
jgi:hypothetical protein